MGLEHTPICDFGWKATDFSLPGTDGKRYALRDVAGPNGTLIMFICNHCPYVVAILDRLQDDMRELQAAGIGVAAICSNDSVAYPQDGLDKMRELALNEDFSFPYLHDEDQQVARAYNAVCTPDFFGFDASGGLQYRGRLDDAGKGPKASVTDRELVLAMLSVASGKGGPEHQTSSMGCSIKWKP